MWSPSTGGCAPPPTNFAPIADSAARRLFTDDAIIDDLARLRGEQQADGGWVVDFASASPAAILECRSYTTVQARTQAPQRRASGRRLILDRGLRPHVLCALRFEGGRTRTHPKVGDPRRTITGPTSATEVARMLVSVFVRRLQEGRTYDDFRRAWYPDEGFGVPARVLSGVSPSDPRDVLNIGFVDLAGASLDEVLRRIAANEQKRHDRIAEVLEATTFRSMFDLVADDDFTAAPRPFEPRGEGLLRLQ